MQISKRLEMVADLVTPGLKVADIGTDHAYIPIYLVERQSAPCALAMDVNRGPLSKAVENIAVHGLNEQIETRLSDGLTAMRAGEAESIIIAGMGGPLTIRILQDGADRLTGCQELVLQPQSEIRLVRAYLEQEGWKIVREEMILEDGKYYPMMKAVRRDPADTTRTMTDEQLRFGALLLERKHPVLLQFLNKEKGVQEKILASLDGQSGEAACERRAQVEKELTYVENALKCFEE